MSHFIVCLTALPCWNLCWAPCWEIAHDLVAFPLQSGTECLWGDSKPWKDWCCGAQPGQWGLGRSPSLLQEHTDTAHSDEPVWSPTCCFEEESGPGWYLSEAKEGKKNKTSYSCYKPNHPPYKRLFPHLHVRDNSKSVSAVRHEWKMKTKLLDIIK